MFSNHVNTYLLVLFLIYFWELCKLPPSLGCNIVVTTLATSIHLVALSKGQKTVKGYFGYIVIDEAGQALETEAMIPLGLAVENTVVVLSGDHIQIRPKV